MKKNVNIYKYEIIERIIKEIDFDTKEEVVDFAKKVKAVALKRDDLDSTVVEAFEKAYEDIKDELTLQNLKEVKKIMKELVKINNEEI